MRGIKIKSEVSTDVPGKHHLKASWERPSLGGCAVSRNCEWAAGGTDRRRVGWGHGLRQERPGHHQQLTWGLLLGRTDMCRAVEVSTSGPR